MSRLHFIVMKSEQTVIWSKAVTVINRNVRLVVVPTIIHLDVAVAVIQDADSSLGDVHHSEFHAI